MACANPARRDLDEGGAVALVEALSRSERESAFAPTRPEPLEIAAPSAQTVRAEDRLGAPARVDEPRGGSVS